MPARVPITVWHWVGFIVVVLILVALDLGLFQRSVRSVKTKTALIRTGIWLGVALLFSGVLWIWLGQTDALEFVTGYFVEFSLSMDNVVAIALIFASFGVAASSQPRVLVWGIFGALVMRGVMIGAGAALLQAFHWVLYILGAFLILTGVKWAFSNKKPDSPKNHPVLRLARKIFPVSENFDGNKFFIWVNHRRVLTPLALVLIMVETIDLIFAVDSIPAVFAVTQKPFIVFTSNIFAVLGLRSLYFAVAGALQYFRYLKTGLAVVLIFVGAKMIAARWYEISTSLSLVVIAAIFVVSIGLSIRAVRSAKT